MPCTGLELQIADYLEGSLDAATKAQVEAHLADCASCRGVVGMWDRLGALPLAGPLATPKPDFPSRFRQRLGAKPAGSTLSMKWMAIAATLLVGILSYTAGRFTAAPVTMSAEAPPAQDMASLQREVRNLREVVALSLLNQQSASERLRGIQYSSALDETDTEVVSALTRTLRSDPSVNVRLAAADALRRYTMPPAVRDSILDLLDREESPLVQVAVIDLMSHSKDAAVRARLEKLRGRAGLDPAVSEYLQAVLSKQRDRGNTYQ